MASMVTLEIVTPDRKVLSEEVDYVGAPGIEGEFGVLPNHVPFLSALGVGSLHYKQGGKTYYVFISGGFAEVSQNKCTVLAEVAELAHEIDVNRAKKAQERAEKRAQKKKQDLNVERQQIALKRAIMRIGCTDAGRRSGTC